MMNDYAGCPHDDRVKEWIIEREKVLHGGNSEKTMDGNTSL